MPTPDYYQVLQLSPEAEPEVIEAAYKRLAFKYHADRNSAPDAHARMTLLNEAFGILGRAESRAAYDRERSAAWTAPSPPTTASANSVSFPWLTFWRYPFTGHPYAPWVVIGIFVIVLPVFFRWVLGSWGTGWFAPLGGTLSATILLLLNRSRVVDIAHLDRSVPEPVSAGCEAGWKALGFLILCGAFGAFVIWRGLDGIGLGQSGLGRFLIRCQIEWGVWVGLLPLLFLWRAHRGARASLVHRPEARVPGRLYGFALLACLAGGIIGPSSPLEWRARGGRAINNDDWEAAAAAVDRAIARYPDYAEAYEDRAAIWRFRGDRTRELADLETTLQLDPHALDALLRRAQLAAERADWAKAAADAKAAVAILERKDIDKEENRTRLGQAQASLALYLLCASDLNGALSAAEQSIRWSPKNPAIHVTKGRAHLHRGEVDAAIACFDEALALDSNDADGYWFRAQAFEKKGDKIRAQEDRKKAELLIPSLAPCVSPPPFFDSQANRPAPPPTAQFSASFRSSRIGRGQVLILQNTGATVQSVQIQVGKLARVEIGPLEAGQSKEVGWLELGAELRTTDTVSVWADGRIIKTLIVP